MDSLQVYGHVASYSTTSQNIYPLSVNGSSLGSATKPWNGAFIHDLRVNYINYKYVGSEGGNGAGNSPALIECNEDNYGKMTFREEGIDGGKPNQFYGCTGEGWKML